MTDVTQLPPTTAAGIDVGATKTHMRYLDPETSTVADLSLRTADYSSLEALFEAALQKAKCLPKRIFAGVAGRSETNGDVQVTNHPAWQKFRYQPFVERLGIDLHLVNDIYSVVAGVDASDGLVALTPQLATPDTSAKVVAAMGSGIGIAFMDAHSGIHPTELGHISWQPVAELEAELLKTLQQREQRVFTIEETVSGLVGFDQLYDFVSERIKPGADVQRHAAQFRAAGEPIGPAVSVGALAGDQCCLQVMEIYGSLLGQTLRNIALGALIEAGGAIFLSGSVMQKNQGAQMLMEKTSFHQRFVSQGAVHADFLATVPFFLITDDHVAVKGAYELANK